MFGLFRSQINLQSNRHKKDKLRFKITSASGYKKEIDPKDAPSVLLFPLMSVPSILNTGSSDKLPLIIKGHRRIDIAKGKLIYSGQLIVNYHYDLITFARMLAKISHSFAVGELGDKNFTPFLLDIILNRDYSYIGSLIGQPEYHKKKSFEATSLHHIWLEITDDNCAPMTWKWVVVYIQLFTPWSDVIYTIVVGRLKPTPSILSWKGLNRLTTPELEAFRRQYSLIPRHPTSLAPTSN
jgi:hypothetical protein